MSYLWLAESDLLILGKFLDVNLLTNILFKKKKIVCRFQENSTLKADMFLDIELISLHLLPVSAYGLLGMRNIPSINMLNWAPYLAYQSVARWYRYLNSVLIFRILEAGMIYKYTYYMNLEGASFNISCWSLSYCTSGRTAWVWQATVYDLPCTHFFSIVSRALVY